VGKLLDFLAEDEEVAPESSIDQRPEADDFEIVVRIIRDRGLVGNPTIRRAVNILFPEHGSRNWSMRIGLAPIVGTDYLIQTLDNTRPRNAERN
jgi:hypothetical protein